MCAGCLDPAPRPGRTCHAPTNAKTKPQAGALAAFLRELLLAPCAYASAIEADLQRCLELHFAEMPSLVPQLPGALPQEYMERLAAHT